VTRFSYADDPEHVVIDLSEAHVFDASTVAALDGIEQRFAKHGSTVEVVNLDTGSIALHGKLSGHLG
jgi:SulP family sulfate permease